MALKLYNTLTKRVEPFVPLTPGRVGLYNCGPTVYHYCHIGNMRTALAVDLLRRYLQFSGYQVTHVTNITDVGHLTEEELDSGEDKMQAGARRENKTIWDVAKFYTDAFFADCKHLNITPSHHYPRATEYVPEMIKMIEMLLEKGYAYRVGANVYYDTSKFADYGKLSGNKLEELDEGHRIEINPEKKHPRDFALWKSDPGHLMQWDTPWGRGFPGWHLECSVMGMKLLGEQFDIHMGGEDLIFPHHECEIAQSEAVTGRQFVRYWLHVHFLMVDGGKMAKSAGNFYTVNDILAKGFSARELRYHLMSTHYRQGFNFTLEGLRAARNTLARIDEFVDKLAGAPDGPAKPEIPALCAKAADEFAACLDEDLNISGALAAFFSLMTEINRRAVSRADAREVSKTLARLDSVLGVLDMRSSAPGVPSELIKRVEALVAEREQARLQKNWKRSDEIRKELVELGVVVKDGPQGPVWKFNA